MSILLLAISILPVILLMIYIYRKDKYEKEPLGLLIGVFIAGILAIPLDLIAVSIVDSYMYSNTVFYSAFIQAGFCEELSKFALLYLIIWWNKNFNEYMDGIVYATFLSLGFACVENILYVFDGGIGTGIVRALLSVPGHFLFAVIMGYFFSMAKFNEKGRTGYLLSGLFGAVLAHGLFDWMLMITEKLPLFLSILIILVFIVGDIMLWIICVRYIKQHQERSQFKDQNPSSDTGQTAQQRPQPFQNAKPKDYQHIDWDAGNKF